MEEEKTTEVKERSDLKLIIIGLVFFLAAMAGTYFLINRMMAPLFPEKQSEKQSEKQDATAGNLVSIGEFTTNIDDVAGTRFLKMEVFAEVDKENKKNQKIITEAMPIIRDSILNIISSKTAADLDVRNRDDLKAEIKGELNKKIGSDIVLNIYFTTFVMQ